MLYYILWVVNYLFSFIFKLGELYLNMYLLLSGAQHNDLIFAYIANDHRHQSS